MRENQYQAKLIKKLGRMFPGCVIIMGDPIQQQGILDFFILWGPHWASLEVKTYRTADRQPNQDYFVDKLNRMSFASYIYPENEKEVLDALQQAFESSR